MPFDKSTVVQVQLMFAGLNTANSINIYPKAGLLRDSLNDLIDAASSATVTVNQPIINNFATASIEMWHRAIHSFITSASLTKTSPLWASVSGYYSSHYSIRAFAHLLGYFLLYSKNKCTIQLDLTPAHRLCHKGQKTSNDGEHRFYWKKVHDHPDFILDPFFTTNIEHDEISDSGHRNKANYYDHIYGFQQFQVLDEPILKQRIQTLSRMQFYDAPIPSKSGYPDIDNVQLVAYYRLVKFRSFLDEILGTAHRYWAFHRQPNWCSDLIKFQVAKTEFATIFSE
jgi:hypothetical protein